MRRALTSLHRIRTHAFIRQRTEEVVRYLRERADIRQRGAYGRAGLRDCVFIELEARVRRTHFAHLYSW
jgi:hypothetical protein